MLENIDLSRRTSREEFKAQKDKLELALGVLQRRCRDLGLPVIILFEGWDAAGKGTLINNLILPLDPRGFTVHSTLSPTEEESLRPFLWRFWTRIPARGRIAIFDRSWYRRVWNEAVEGSGYPGTVAQAYEDIQSFERQLADDGCVLIKFFLHISKKEQKKRFDKLLKNPTTAWRVTDEDRKRHRQYKKYLTATEEMLVETDSDHTPWTVIEAHDERFAVLKVFNVVIQALEDAAQRTSKKQARRARARTSKPAVLRSTAIDRLDLTLSLERDDYRRKLKRRQKRLRTLEHEIYMRRVPVIIVYEGCDAAGKGGNIKRLTEELDPRGYEVEPIAAPNDIERSHHYLWRFWTRIPKAGHITIFDRSWYGRVLVERIEGFCAEQDWRRAYREINEMEQHFTNLGGVIVKFWLQIDRDEQLRRFKAREGTPHKQWKITAEDWRNRDKWDAYKVAVEEMLTRTSTRYAPWTIVESNCKLYARVKTLDTVIHAIERALE